MDQLTSLNQVAGNYSADAQAYEAGWAPVLAPYTVGLLDRLSLSGTQRVLDAGAGVGTILSELERRVPHALVVGVDCAAGMLTRAPMRFPRALMDVQRLGFRPGTFDVVVMAFILFHTEDPLLALREACRVLRPGGRAGAITWDGEIRCEAQRVLMEELEAAGAPPGSPSWAVHEPLSTPEKTQALFGEAGLEMTEAWTAPFEHVYDPESYLSLRTGRGQVRRRLESLPPGRQQLVLDRARDRLAGLQASDHVDRAGLVYTVGTR